MVERRSSDWHYALAEELASHGVTALAITPGFLRTEAILEKFGVSEDNWREAAENNAEAKRFGFIDSESSLLRGPGRRRRGRGSRNELGGREASPARGALSEVYGFTDLDGSRPNIWPAVAEHVAGGGGPPPVRPTGGELGSPRTLTAAPPPGSLRRDGVAMDWTQYCTAVGMNVRCAK